METPHRNPDFPTRNSPDENPGESGIALFIVIVLVVVLVVVVTQLTFVTKIEEQIARSRKGLLELELAIEAAGRHALLKVQEDWEEDVGSGASDPCGNPAGDLSGPGTVEDFQNQSGSNRDSRHETWAHPFDERLNECTVKVKIADGESRIDLNYLFEYVEPEEEDEPDPDDPNAPDPDPSPPDPDPDPDADPDAEEEEEWTPPTQEEELATQDFLARLIEAIIAYNQENNFDYEDNPSADAAAENIMDYVLERQERPETRTIRSIDQLAQLSSVGWELFRGPLNPEAQELAEDAAEDAEDRPSGGSPFDQLEGLADQLGFSLDGFEELEDGLGEIPEPLGLRDFFTTFSTGKLNINTVRPEMLIALMTSIEDFDEAAEIAYEIDDYLNQYASDEELDASDPLGAAGDLSDSDEDLDEDEEGSQEFNIFGSLDDLSKVNEEWEDEAIGEDETVLELLKKDLARMVFRSDYFNTRLEGNLKGRELVADLVFHRDLEEKEIKVLVWKLSRTK